VARASGSVGALVLAALVPKCPFCIAAALTALGMGAGVSSAVAPVVRPAALVLAGLAIVLAAWGAWRRSKDGTACAKACGSSAHEPP